MRTPVLLIIFNRPDKVRRLMESLEKARPSRIYIGADGPRASKPLDKEKCAEARRIAQAVTWPCEVRTNFLTENVGVDKGMESAIGWFFANEEEGIICEDDCIPSDDFFRYSEELLQKYRNDEKVMMICGTNFQDGIKRGDASYYASRYPTWGWATWRRAWQKYDEHLDGLDELIREKKIDGILTDPEQQKFWLDFFGKIRKGKFSFVDTKWLFSMWNNGGICLIPNANLVRNIGFDKEATHARIGADTRSVETEGLGEIRHPASLAVNEEADTHFFNKIHRTSLLRKLTHKARSLFW
jgi:hypothetical protein